MIPTTNVTSQAPTPTAKINNEYPNPCRNRAIKKAIGVAKLIGVKAVPTVRGKRKIPTIARIPRIIKAPPIPELKREPSVESIVHAAPRYEISNPIPARKPIIISTPNSYILLQLLLNQAKLFYLLWLLNLSFC